MQNKIEVYDLSDYKLIGILNANYVLPIGTHFIINNVEYIIIDYLLIDYDITTLKIIVRKTNDNERNYIHKIL